MVFGKGSVKMKLKSEIKSLVASVAAAVMFIANNPTVFASYRDGSAESIRLKALGEYYSANAHIVAMATSAPTIIDNVVKNAKSAKGVTYSEITESENLAYNTVKKLNSNLEAGTIVTINEGEAGKAVRTVKVKYVDGEEVSREILSEEVVKQPVDKVVEYGSKNATANSPVSTGALNYKRVIECNATAYDLSPEENGGYGGMTATGVPLDKGVIAVDPRVIPLGSRVYIEAIDGSWSYGYAVAADTGGAIKGNRVDLCYRTRSECIQFGRRKCRVYILN